MHLDKSSSCSLLTQESDNFKIIIFLKIGEAATSYSPCTQHHETPEIADSEIPEKVGQRGGFNNDHRGYDRGV